MVAGGAKRSNTSATRANKKPKLSIPCPDSPVKRDLLQKYYSHVQSLRQHLLAKLPTSSRLRRKKISALGNAKDGNEAEARLSLLLDTTLVCCKQEQEQEHNDDTRELRWQQWVSFSQQEDESRVTISDPSTARDFQSEVCYNFVQPVFFS